MLKNSSQFIFPLLIITVLLYLYRITFWPLTFVFLVSFSLLVLVYLLNLNKSQNSNFLSFFLFPLITAISFILSSLLGQTTDLTDIARPSVNILVLFFLIYILCSKLSISTFLNKERVILKSSIITLLSLAVLNLLIKGPFNNIIPSTIYETLNISEGTTIANDRNFFCLYLIINIIFLFYYRIYKKKSLFKGRLTELILIAIFATTILSSGSRRGIIALFAITLFFYFKLIRLFWFQKVNFVKNTGRLLFLSFVASLILIVATYTILPDTSIDTISSGYSSILGFEDNYIGKKISQMKFSKVMPDSNYIIDTKIFNNYPEFWKSPLTISLNETEFISSFGKAYKLKGSFQESRRNELLQYYGPSIIYYANHTYVFKFKIKLANNLKDNIYLRFNDPTSINWYFKEGHGVLNTPIKLKHLKDDWWQASAYYTFNNNHIGLQVSLYSNDKSTDFCIADFNIKDLDYDYNLPKFLFESSQTDFLYWINAHNPPLYPVDNLINNGDFSLGKKYWNSTTKAVNVQTLHIENKSVAKISCGETDYRNLSLVYLGQIIPFNANQTYQICFKLKLIEQGSKLPFNVGVMTWKGDESVKKLPIHIDSLKNGWLKVSAQFKFKKDRKLVRFLINNQKSNSSFLITDIKVSNESVDQILIAPINQRVKNENNFSDPRIERWKDSFDLFKDYSLIQKIFGGGYDYYEYFGLKYLKNKDLHDWPHNPFLSILLYSGILGLLFNIAFFIKAIILYVKYRQKFEHLFVAFILTLFFAFFSSDSLFTPPILGIFMLLPFIIHYLYPSNKPI